MDQLSLLDREKLRRLAGLGAVLDQLADLTQAFLQLELSYSEEHGGGSPVSHELRERLAASLMEVSSAKG